MTESYLEMREYNVGIRMDETNNGYCVEVAPPIDAEFLTSILKKTFSLAASASDGEISNVVRLPLSTSGEIRNVRESHVSKFTSKWGERARKTISTMLSPTGIVDVHFVEEK
jgi:hypothetical protein